MRLVAVPEILRQKLGADGAEALVELLNETGRYVRDDIVTLAEQRFERRVADVEGRIAEVEGRLRADLGGLEARMTERVAVGETRLLRWIVGLSITQFSLLLGVLFAILKL